MNIDLLRHRRNLLLISSTLVLIQIAGVSVGDTISLLGTSLNVENPKVIGDAIWLIWFYLFMRYYQYFLEEEDLGIKDCYKEKLHALMDAYFYKESGHGSPRNFHYPELTDNGGWVYRKHNEAEILLTAPKKRVIFYRICAVQGVILNTPKVTDHILPFVVGLIPLIILVVKCLTRT